MARSPGEKHLCPLFSREIHWALCCEVQEVLDDNMDPTLFPEPFDIEKARPVCGKCRWDVVKIWR